MELAGREISQFFVSNDDRWQMAVSKKIEKYLNNNY